MKNQFKKTILLFATIILGLTSCSKSDSNEEEGNSQDIYNVPITMTLAGETQTATIQVYRGNGSYNCNVVAMQGGADSPKFSFFLNNFVREGGTIDGARTVCNKATLEVGKGLVANRYDCYSKPSSPGTLSLSGNTYTLTCKVYADRNANDTAAGNIEKEYLLTATWTRP